MLASGKYVKSLHIGPYRKVGDTYKRMMTWIAEKNIIPAPECIEIYLNDPRETKKEDLMTEVFIPIKVQPER